ncbi:hypothetical protein [Deinococcus maricopensis]|uniref:Shikimate kinase n=1 Tax=Deinococcus maricopensis (strain DSM 21211 / LMG 22137 / NRRL B-23946 / LB-34) TaxID=709986 RepID=E8U8V4_DEIML|nr:hypothetical protein [Deinococcus maricopensis]ADV67493.1 hypothetical protein Deima_1845 [Deinococcus maricopensis DSM 21211]
MRCLYYLVGWPGSGKRTIGVELARRTGARLIDNHLMNDPVFQAIGADGVRPVPDGAWPLVARVADVVFDAIRTVAPPDLSYVFTNVLVDADEDRAHFARVEALARARQSRFVPVWLMCSTDALLARVGNEDRAARLKLRDPEALAALMARHALLPPEPGALELDTCTLEVESAVERILAHAQQVTSCPPDCN